MGEHALVFDSSSTSLWVQQDTWVIGMPELSGMQGEPGTTYRNFGCMYTPLYALLFNVQKFYILGIQTSATYGIILCSTKEMQSYKNSIKYVLQD